MAEVSLSEQEMIEILEGLARNNRSATAQIQAIKVLREIRSGEMPTSEGFAGLFEVSNPGRMRVKKAS